MPHVKRKPHVDAKAKERSFRTAGSRSGVPHHQSFNSRLGSNGPAESASENLQNNSPNNGCDWEDTCAQLANLTTDSLPVVRKSFNNRLRRSHQDSETDVNINVDQAKSLISSDSANQPALLDELLSKYVIVEGLYSNGHLSEYQDINNDYKEPHVRTQSKDPAYETMSKRDYLGNQKDERNDSQNDFNGRYTLNEAVIREDTFNEAVIKEDTFNEAVIREETTLVVKEDSNISPASQPKDDRSSYSCSNGTFQPKRSESPQCTPEKISRHDFPTSFGSASKRRSYNSEVFEEVENYFNKRYYLSSEDNWELPEASKVFSAQPWEVKELIECKNKLNAVKEKLNNLPLMDWHSHTKKRNKAGEVVGRLRSVVNPEFPTQAWCKFYENVHSFDLVSKKAKQDKRLNSVHLCEAPGAFITSLNHYIKTNFDDDFEWNWLGTTLNPHYEGNPLSLMINEDRFILHTMDHWTFGEDQTGDLMNPPNLDDLMKRCEKLGEILLVTADGSIDCQDTPGEQENYVAWLHYCEAFSALSVLAEGGNFLLKMFTMFEHMTISLLYLLSCVFEEVIINKPATSKEGNSETYAVCKHYAGKDKLEPLLHKLSINFGPNPPRRALFSKESIPEEFLERVIECAETFRGYQSDIIEANLKSYKNPNEREKSRNERIRRAVTWEFFNRYCLKELPEQYDIVGRYLINEMRTYNMDPRWEVGSFSDKLKRTVVSERQKILDLQDDLLRLDRKVLDKWPADKDFWWYEFDLEPGYDLSREIQITTGKPVKCIKSSKFCLGRLLDIRNKVRDIIFESKVCDLSGVNSYTEQLVSVPKTTTVLDFKNTLWASSDADLNAEEEYKAFQRIIEEFDKLSRDDNLVICGYPLLTQFNVGLVYLLAHSFQKVGLARPQGQNFAVVFQSHDVSNRKFKVKQKLDEISETIEACSSRGKTVLTMVPIQKLCRKEFYRYVTLANNNCVMEQVKELITKYLKATESKEPSADLRHEDC